MTDNAVFRLATAAMLAALAGCATMAPYRSVETGPSAELIVEGKRVVDQSINFNKVRFEIHACMFDNQGYLDLTKDTPMHQVKIPSDRPFYSWIQVTKNEFFGRHGSGTMAIAFQPRADEKYKLLYTEKGDAFYVGLYVLDKGSNEWKPSRLTSGFEVWPRCS